MRIVINGFGRIGRTVLRQIISQPQNDDIEVVAINDVAALNSCAYLFQYDSTFGPFPSNVAHDQDHLVVGDQRIPFWQTVDLGAQNLNDVDVVLECTGRPSSREELAQLLTAGAGAVLISGPSDHADLTLVKGANEKSLGQARIVANSSCTTNALAPLLRSIDTALGIEHCHVTTIHCFTGSQPMVDSPRGDLARSRAGAESIVPTTTSAAKELKKVLPKIASKTTVAAVRVPCLSVSALDATLQLQTSIGPSAIEVLRVIAERSSVIGITDDSCVSRDFRARPESVVLALPETQAAIETQLRVFGWYDNEWGFSARMIEMARMLAAQQEIKECANGCQ